MTAQLLVAAAMLGAFLAGGGLGAYIAATSVRDRLLEDTIARHPAGKKIRPGDADILPFRDAR